MAVAAVAAAAAAATATATTAATTAATSRSFALHVVASFLVPLQTHCGVEKPYALGAYQ